MTTQLSVYADPQAEAAGAVAAVVASLPLSFTPAPATPDVTAVAGHAGWTDRASAAIRNGARGVVVSSPVAEDVTELRELVEMHRNDPKLRWQLGLALVAARKLNLALAHLEVAVAQDPSLDQGELADVRVERVEDRAVGAVAAAVEGVQAHVPAARHAAGPR